MCYVRLKNWTFKHVHELGRLFLDLQLEKGRDGVIFFIWSPHQSLQVPLSVVPVLKQSSLTLLLTLAVPFPVWVNRKQGLAF